MARYDALKKEATKNSVENKTNDEYAKESQLGVTRKLVPSIIHEFESGKKSERVDQDERPTSPVTTTKTLVEARKKSLFSERKDEKSSASIPAESVDDVNVKLKVVDIEQSIRNVAPLLVPAASLRHYPSYRQSIASSATDKADLEYTMIESVDAPAVMEGKSAPDCDSSALDSGDTSADIDLYEDVAVIEEVAITVDEVELDNLMDESNDSTQYEYETELVTHGPRLSAIELEFPQILRTSKYVAETEDKTVVLPRHLDLFVGDVVRRGKTFICISMSYFNTYVRTLRSRLEVAESGWWSWPSRTRCRGVCGFRQEMGEGGMVRGGSV